MNEFPKKGGINKIRDQALSAVNFNPEKLVKGSGELREVSKITGIQEAIKRTFK